MIRVLIADDQALVRAGLTALLGSEPDIEVVAVAADGTEALALARELRPDVACLDIRMPGADGIEVAAALSGPGADPAIPVLMLTTFDLDDYVFGALAAGASGFLLKDADPDVIVNAVRQVAAGNGTLDSALTRRVLREFVQRRRLQPVTGDRGDGLLTARERDVLLEVARGHTNAEIAQRLFLSEATVKTHVGHLLAKLELRNRVQAVICAYDNGLVRPG